MKKKTKRILKPRTRNLNTMTEPMYWSSVRSALRQAFRYWKPAVEAKKLAKRTVKGKRHRAEFQCNKCKDWFKDKEVQVDHIIGVGSLKNPSDLVLFLQRLTPESPDAFQVLCKQCHAEKTYVERYGKKKGD